MRDHFFDTVDLAAQRTGNRTPITRLDVCEDGETVNLTTTGTDAKGAPVEVTVALSGPDASMLARVLDMLSAGL